LEHPVTKYASDLPDFKDLLAATAQARPSLTAAIVEKDYYVVRALRALQDGIGDQFIFKGGTSLSKGWNLINRFSEDIDLLFRVNHAGTKISGGEVDRRLQNAEDLVRKTAGFTFLTQTRSRSVRRCSNFSYPQAAGTTKPLSDTIRLEMGTRGGVEPSTVRPVRSFVAEFTEAKGMKDVAEDLAPFNVECLSITRTCVEKLFAVHAAFERDRALNRTRHYYDLYHLLGIQEVTDFLGSDKYRNVFADVLAYSQENFSDGAMPPEGGFSKSAAFRPSEEDLKKLKQNYAAEKDIFFGEAPTMEVIIARLKLSTSNI
jgi:predicted nucleotidyltransferase component of viral defense system